MSIAKLNAARQRAVTMAAMRANWMHLAGPLPANSNTAIRMLWSNFEAALAAAFDAGYDYGRNDDSD